MSTGARRTKLADGKAKQEMRGHRLGERFLDRAEVQSGLERLKKVTKYRIPTPFPNRHEPAIADVSRKPRPGHGRSPWG